MKKNKSTNKALYLVPVLVGAMVLTSWTTLNKAKVVVDGVKEILGAGATFPFPYYSKLFDEYNKKTGVKVNYQSIGSGGGIKQLQAKTVDFGASDAPMSDDEMKASPGPIVHIPTCLGADVITYNLPGVATLKFSGDVVADIFLWKITKWNDKRLMDLNAGVKLPDMAISVIHRSDGSGTTYIFSDYLSKVSPVWKTKPGKGKSLDWPTGLGAKGNEGVSGMIKQTPGSIGYVELIYAIENKMPVGKLKNKSGNFIDASIQSVTAAGNVQLPPDTRVSITDTDVKDGYPISSFTYLLVYKTQNYDTRTEAQAKGTMDLIWWVLHDGQKLASPLNYAPLPAAAVKAAEANAKSIMFNNKALIK